MQTKLLALAVVAVMVGATVSVGEDNPQPTDATVNATPTTAANDFLPPAPLPRDAVPVTQAAMLKQKLAERDRLQREIDALRAATGTAGMVLVSVQMLEVNLTKLREIGNDIALPEVQVGKLKQWLSREDASSAFIAKKKAAEDVVAALEKHSVARVLTEPKIMTVSGRPASIRIGGEVPIRSSDGQGRIEYRNFGTEVQLLAETLSENRVRMTVAPRVAEIDECQSIEEGDQRIPGFKVRQCSFTTEVESGQSAVVSGTIQERTEAIKAETGSASKTVEIALMVVVTPEIVK